MGAGEGYANGPPPGVQSKTPHRCQNAWPGVHTVLAKVHSCALIGLDGAIVEVEADLNPRALPL